MKWAQTHEVGTAFFQRDIAPHNVHDIDALQKVLDERSWNGHKRNGLAGQMGRSQGKKARQKLPGIKKGKGENCAAV